MNASSNHKPAVALRSHSSDRLSAGGHVGLLTLERSDEHVAILDELFDELVGPLQLYFMALETLSEVRAVQERVAELQRGESHRGSGAGSPFTLCNSACETVNFSSRSSDVTQPTPSSNSRKKKKFSSSARFLTSALVFSPLFFFLFFLGTYHGK